jgi:hypothetical protein
MGTDGTVCQCSDSAFRANSTSLTTSRQPQDPHSPLIKSDTLFQLYLYALVKSGNEKSVISATRRREALLQLPPPPESTPAQNPATENLSKSEQIAQSILRGDPIPLGTPSLLGVDAGKAAANSVETPQLAAGSGVAGNPIVVTLKERKFPIASNLCTTFLCITPQPKGLLLTGLRDLLSGWLLQLSVCA